MIILQTARLIVRHFTVDDLPGFHRLSSDENVMKFIGPVITLAGCKVILEDIISAYSSNAFSGRFAVTARGTDSYAGNFLLRNAWDGSGTEVGFALFQAEQGKGYATELTTQGCTMAFAQLQATRVFGTVDSRNLASIHVLEKCGFNRGAVYTDNGRELVCCELLKK